MIRDQIGFGVILAAGLLAASPAFGRDDQDRATDGAVDTRINASTLRVIREGVTLFNEQGDQAGCYRLYRGALIGLSPALEHRPDLRFVVDRALERATDLAATNPAQAALELREALDRLYKQTRPGNSDRSLWERLGGEPKVRAVVQDLVAMAAGDEDVNLFRDGRVELDARSTEELERAVVGWISAKAGGPLSVDDGAMQVVHRGIRISGDEFNAIAADLVAVLRKHDVPQDEIDELLAIVATARDEVVEDNTLWDRLGGEERVRAVVADFVARAASNPRVDVFRDGRYVLDEAGVARLEQRLVEWVGSTTGGPLDYTGRDMETAHEGMGITEAEFDAMALDLAASLDRFDVPRETIDEVLAIVAATKDDIVEGN